MKRCRLAYALAALLVLALPAACLAAGLWVEVPSAASSDQFGNVLMNRLSQKHGQPWVMFSHWTHRTRYTCRVCHLELGFEMRVNSTEITEEKNRRGEFCGACHNGTAAFGHTEEHCGACHSGDLAFVSEKFKDLSGLPSARFGNRIDWTAAMDRKLISPAQSLFDKGYSPVPFGNPLYFDSVVTSMPDAFFPHQAHIQWLDCANCHPDIFTIKQKKTDHLSMEHFLQGKFCGVCHLTVAFPINDCVRCHPKERR